MLEFFDSIKIFLLRKDYDMLLIVIKYIEKIKFFEF